MATSETGPLRADWFAGGVDEARERWPDADVYADATDMTDEDFDYLVINGKPRLACGGKILCNSVYFPFTSNAKRI